MRNISANLQTHLESGLTTLSILLTITRTDATVLRLTNHDVQINYGGNNYSPSGFSSNTDIAQLTDLSPDNVDLEFGVAGTIITESDLISGVYDDATVSFDLVNRESLADGSVRLITGRLSNVRVDGKILRADVAGLADNLKKKIGRVYGHICDTKLGSARCGVNLASFTTAGAVTSVTGNGDFTDSSIALANDYFKYGTITFTSGLNSGLSMDVKSSYASGRFVTVVPFPFTVAIADTFNAVAGCDHTAATCKSKFSNLVNFQGFPHVPNRDEIIKAGGK